MPPPMRTRQETFYQRQWGRHPGAAPIYTQGWAGAMTPDELAYEEGRMEIDDLPQPPPHTEAERRHNTCASQQRPQYAAPLGLQRGPHMQPHGRHERETRAEIQQGPRTELRSSRKEQYEARPQMKNKQKAQDKEPENEDEGINFIQVQLELLGIDSSFTGFLKDPTAQYVVSKLVDIATSEKQERERLESEREHWTCSKKNLEGQLTTALTKRQISPPMGKTDARRAKKSHEVSPRREIIPLPQMRLRSQPPQLRNNTGVGKPAGFRSRVSQVRVRCPFWPTPPTPQPVPGPITGFGFVGVGLQQLQVTSPAHPLHCYLKIARFINIQPIMPQNSSSMRSNSSIRSVTSNAVKSTVKTVRKAAKRIRTSEMTHPPTHKSSPPAISSSCISSRTSSTTTFSHPAPISDDPSSGDDVEVETDEAELKCLQATWQSPVYGFFKRDVQVGFEDGRKYHLFRCAAQKCKNTAGVHRYQDSKDRATTSNLKAHALKCFGEAAVSAAFSKTTPCTWDGSIFASFAFVFTD
ncbi:hypothetical protein BD779DRAFT_1681862 [Infundibulicybe gibba]|nr:hypothetical protein BD779DRAFT_1681862 [Infundibulicybe gibba]